jgi:integrase/recombinase XerD
MKDQNTGSSRFDSLLERYANHLQERSFKPKSVQGARVALRRFCAFAVRTERLRIVDVSSLDLERYRLSLSGLSVSTQQFYLVHLRQFFRWLEHSHQLFLNPAVKLCLPKRPKLLAPVPTEDQVRRLLGVPNLAHPAGLRDRAWLEVAYSTGARLIEMTRMTVADVDLHYNSLRLFGKGDKERLVPLGKQAHLWLRRYLDEVRPALLEGKALAALWLSSWGGRPLSYVAMYRQLRTYAKQTGIPKALVSPHSLRRACVTHMLHRGASPFLLKELLGHSRVATLSHYLRQNFADLKRAHRQSSPGR